MKIGIPLVFSFALATSCVPIPHYKNYTPLAEGTILRQGLPVPNLHVRAVAGAAANTPCTARSSDGTTDANGYFVLKPLRNRRLFVFVLPADATFQWHLCAQENGEWRIINESRDFTLADSGPWWISEIQCDLSAAQPCAEHRNTSYTQEDVRRLFERAN